MSSQICLKWNSFLNNIATSFESLWEEEGLVDVTLASDGRCLTAHKVILSASSPFFKKVFQTNPCQHPVIVLQDVRFTELEALLIFIYKGEVNIEQRNLPALLKAAETLQIRGLSGGDIFSNESYERLVELEQEAAEDETRSTKEDAPRKKQRISKRHCDSGAEKLPNSRLSRTESTSESTSSEQSGKDTDFASSENLPNPVYHRLEMKIEPLEVTMEDLQKDSPLEKDTSERLDTKAIDEMQESSIINTNTTPDYSRTLSVSPKPIADDSISGPSELETQSSSFFLSRTHNETMSNRMEDTISSQTMPCTTLSQPLLSTLGPTDDAELSEETLKSKSCYLPYPCPFCDRAYTNWGFRRRHIKVAHTISSSLNCKWCCQVLPTYAAWSRHVMSIHNLSAKDAHNGGLGRSAYGSADCSSL